MEVNMLKIENVRKKFTDKTILDGVDLEVNESSIFGLVGVNGAGKSTLLRCIAGVYQTDEGSIALNGSDTYRDASIRKDIIFISDDPYLPPTANIDERLEFYAAFYDLDLKTAENIFHFLN